MKVCFVAPHALPVFEPSATGLFGGLETRAWLLARGLARRPGIRVGFFVAHEGRLPKRSYDGVQVFAGRMPFLDRVRRSVSDRAVVGPPFPYIRPKRWDPVLLWQVPLLTAVRPFKRPAPPADPCRPDPAFRRIPADVFCCFGVNEACATAVASAKARGAKVLLFLACDADLVPEHRSDKTDPDYVRTQLRITEFVFGNADAVVAQTERQLGLLRDVVGRDGRLIPNPFEVEEWDSLVPPRPDPGLSAGLERYALWVGRTDTFHKRPLLLLDLARRCPDVPFLMNLGVFDREVERRVREERPPNVSVIPPIPFRDMPALFRGAGLYVSTGSKDVEGLPNVFLQSAASRVPIASLEMDPGFVGKEDAGFCADGDLASLAGYVNRVWSDDALARRQGENGRRYVIERHRSDAVLDRVEDALRELVGAATPA